MGDPGLPDTQEQRVKTPLQPEVHGLSQGGEVGREAEGDWKNISEKR